MNAHAHCDHAAHVHAIPAERAPAMPHGPIEPVFDGIWFVRGGWDMPFRLKPRISRSMTIIRHPGSPTTA